MAQEQEHYSERSCDIYNDGIGTQVSSASYRGKIKKLRNGSINVKKQSNFEICCGEGICGTPVNQHLQGIRDQGTKVVG